MPRLQSLVMMLSVCASSSGCSAKPEVEQFIHTQDTTGGTTAADATGETSTGVLSGTTGVLGDDSCSVMLDDDCGTFEKCNVSFTFATDVEQQCVPVQGDDQPGESCASQGTLDPNDTCDRGATCLTDEFDRNGRCVEFCDEFRECDDPDRTCISVYGKELPLCVETCDPLDPDTCTDDWICHEVAGLQNWYCAPRLGGQTGGHGSPCAPNELGLCAPGFACVPGPNVDSPSCLEPASDAGCCGMLCELGEDATCPSELEECLPFYSAPPPGRETLGICAVQLAPRG